MDRNRLARYAAPAAFLAAVTIGVVVIRAGFEHGRHPATTVTTKATTTHRHGHGKERAKTYTIRSGDTLASIAAKTGTTVVALMHLNPGIDANALRIGQKIRVK